MGIWSNLTVTYFSNGLVQSPTRIWWAPSAGKGSNEYHVITYTVADNSTCKGWKITPVIWPLIFGHSYCWWFRNPANQLRWVVFSPLFTGFCTSQVGCLGISEASTVGAPCPSISDDPSGHPHEVWRDCCRSACERQGDRSQRGQRGVLDRTMVLFWCPKFGEKELGNWKSTGFANTTGFFWEISMGFAMAKLWCYFVGLYNIWSTNLPKTWMLCLKRERLDKLIHQHGFRYFLDDFFPGPRLVKHSRSPWSGGGFGDLLHLTLVSVLFCQGYSQIWRALCPASVGSRGLLPLGGAEMSLGLVHMVTLNGSEKRGDFFQGIS